MSEKKQLQNIKLRRCILNTLYTFFKEYPYAEIELREVKKVCHANTKELNWNMVYLEKCGYVELSKSIDSLPFIACSASLTAKGIDLIESGKKFNKLFPVQRDSKSSQTD